MNSGNDKRPGQCRKCEQLAVWYPTRALTDEEKSLVEGHAAECASCAELLGFVIGFHETLVEAFSGHPDPETLVQFAEDPAIMTPSARAIVETHIEACSECRAEIEMLHAVDLAAGADDGSLARSGSASSRSAEATSRLSRWREIFSSLVLRPAAAAVYLIVAVAAIGLLISRVDRSSDAIGVLGGVSVLSDEAGVVRGAGSSPGVTTIEAEVAGFLLLELTGPDIELSDDDQYEVRIIGGGGSEPVYAKSISGGAFSYNYTLCLFLQGGTLEPGEYRVRVIDPEGSVIFSSSLAVE
ncbi:MAG: hypothetical protein JW814_01810 [Candidatus Krumholzibacteriota bacterium]|nr:hypothetical protein [Candidatus Krumholzibacteriota bacterium]